MPCAFNGRPTVPNTSYSPANIFSFFPRECVSLPIVSRNGGNEIIHPSTSTRILNGKNSIATNERPHLGIMVPPDRKRTVWAYVGKLYKDLCHANLYRRRVCNRRFWGQSRTSNTYIICWQEIDNGLEDYTLAPLVPPTPLSAAKYTIFHLDRYN